MILGFFEYFYNLNEKQHEEFMKKEHKKNEAAMSNLIMMIFLGLIIFGNTAYLPMISEVYHKGSFLC